LRLLLDTPVFLWWWSGDHKIGAATRREIARAADVSVSAATAGEIVIKSALGKLRFEGAISDAIRSCPFAELPVAIKHAEALLGLPRYHTDPFDRISSPRRRQKRAPS
jgi:PIN domain nuclease of toxin-antitoxin system